MDSMRNIVPGNEEPRLIAVCIGINGYCNKKLPRLENAVADAESIANGVEQTQPKGQAVVFRVFSSSDANRGSATRDGMVSVLRQASDMAEAQDTVLVFFAGHGTIADGQAVLLPEDADQEANGAKQRFLGIAEIQSIFKDCKSKRRLLLLDACQTPQVGALGLPINGEAGPGEIKGGRNWRARGLVSSEFVETLGQESAGWAILMACSPDQLSFEKDDHGLFSYRVATGLRGEADLNGDGLVTLGELIAYLGTKVPEDARLFTEFDQDPSVIWQGPAALPIARIDIPGTHAEHAQYRRKRWPDSGFAGLWAKRMIGRWPYRDIVLPGFIRYGIGSILAVLLSIEAMMFPAHDQHWQVYLIACIGLASFLLWIALVAFAVAACEQTWHAGGYLTATGIGLWHAVVFIILKGLLGHAGPATIQLGIDLIAVTGVVVAMGINSFQTIIALAELLSKGDRSVVMTTISELDRKWFWAKIPNSIALQSIHPMAHMLLFGIVGGGILVWHMGLLLSASSLTEKSGIGVFRDLMLLVLIWSLVAWYQAAYRFISGQARPKV